MLTEDVLSRLQRLNRQTVPLWHLAGGKRPRSQSPPPCELPGGVEVEQGSGRHWLIDRRVGSLWRGSQQFIENRQEDLRFAAEHEKIVHPELRRVAEHFPHGVLYLDLETCGLAGSMIFLVGLVRQTEQGLVLSQLLARNYAEEKAVLETFWRTVADTRVLVTFNGKSFDWPLVHDRSTLHHLGIDARRGPWGLTRRSPVHAADHPDSPAELSPDDPRPELIHCDLLHHARRVWRDRLPDCKLQTLERFICGRHRAGDMPGRAIPAAYHDFVRTGDAWQIKAILQHNALDLITLVQLSLRILQRAGPLPGHS